MKEVRSTTDHNHESDPFHIAAMKLKAEIKASVEVNRGKPHQIVTDKLHNAPVQVIFFIIVENEQQCYRK